MKGKVVLYECGICEAYHRWSWDGDCRDDSARIPSPEEFAEEHGFNILDVEVRSMEERVAADEEGLQ